MAVCPFCDCSVSEDFVVFGGEILHSECFQELGEELESVFAPSSYVIVKDEETLRQAR